MKFNLNYTPPKVNFEINHKHKLFLAGSCFAENMGDLLDEHKFETLSNSSGILFNPFSIYRSLIDSIEQIPFDVKYSLEKGDEHFSFLHHSAINESSIERLVHKIDQLNTASFGFLKECNYLIITFGSAFYYNHTELNICVANCHKQPGTIFEKKILSVNQIVEAYNKLISKLININSSLKMIFTVSPVKYLKDGIVENNLSKATLLLSVNELVQNNKSCFYFPAYELVIDDLRDYRFYKADMAHPNDLAIKYIWEKFSETYFNDKTKHLNEKIHELNVAMKHKTLHNNSMEALKFKKYISELSAEIKALESRI